MIKNVAIGVWQEKQNIVRITVIILAKKKEYREQHADKIKAYRQLTIRCDVCDCDINRDRQSQHYKTKKHTENLGKTEPKEPKGLATLYTIMN